jgi:hypothetical protein
LIGNVFYNNISITNQIPRENKTRIFDTFTFRFDFELHLSVLSTCPAAGGNEAALLSCCDMKVTLATPADYDCSVHIYTHWPVVSQTSSASHAGWFKGQSAAADRSHMLKWPHIKTAVTHKMCRSDCLGTTQPSGSVITADVYKSRLWSSTSQRLVNSN